MIGNIIFDRLTAEAAVAAVVGTRVYPQLLPQEPTLPAITYDISLGPPSLGSAPIRDATIRVTGWTEQNADTQSLGDKIVDALDGWSDRSGTAQLLSCIFTNSVDLYDPELDLWGLSITFTAIVANH